MIIELDQSLNFDLMPNSLAIISFDFQQKIIFFIHLFMNLILKFD